MILFLQALVSSRLIIRERFLHLKVNSEERTAKAKDHIKYALNGQKLLKVERVLSSENQIRNITVTAENLLKINNLKITQISDNHSSKLKVQTPQNKYSISFDVDLQKSKNLDHVLVTYQYEVLNFLKENNDTIAFLIDFDHYDNYSQPYHLETKLDIALNSLFGENNPAQVVIENEENYKWKTQREKNEIHVFIQAQNYTGKVIKGSYIMSNFNREDKFSYSHTHNEEWDFNDWYHHHGHANKKFNNEGGDHMMLDMGFAFAILFCIFGCIFYPILCSNGETESEVTITSQKNQPTEV